MGDMSGALALTVIGLGIAGHVLIVRTILNRTYELGLPQRVWNLLFFVHIAAAIAGAVIVARIADSPWRAAHRLGLAYLAACYLALAIGAVVLVLRRRQDAKVAAACATRAELLDGCAALGRVPAGRTALARVARAMPGNEIFRVEFVERQIRLPRLPAALDGLSATCTSTAIRIGRSSSGPATSASSATRTSSR